MKSDTLYKIKQERFGNLHGYQIKTTGTRVNYSSEGKWVFKQCGLLLYEDNHSRHHVLMTHKGVEFTYDRLVGKYRRYSYAL